MIRVSTRRRAHANASIFAVAAITLLAACSPRGELCTDAGVGVVPPSDARGQAEPATDAPTFVEVDPRPPTLFEVGFRGDGIYVLPGDPDSLVLFRTDGEHAPISLLRPIYNAKNQWQFELPGERLEPSDPRLAKAIKLPHEGFYRSTRELRFEGGGLWLTGAIVQLGYREDGTPIVFIAQRLPGEQNVLFFSDKGVEIRLDQLQWLEPLAWYQAPSEPVADP